MSTIHHPVFIIQVNEKYYLYTQTHLLFYINFSCVQFTAHYFKLDHMADHSL